MRFALVDGVRLEAHPKLVGDCPACSGPVIARCGEMKVWHWAHRRRQVCDKWWESETEWHRAWKRHFPDDWQEIVHRSDSGERHISDVKTPSGWVIEFQHSYLAPQERRSRDAFYAKLLWVVDATRRSRDTPQLLRSWVNGAPLGGRPIRRVRLDDCVLLTEWAGTRGPVFFDSGEVDSMWWLLAVGRGNWGYLARFSRAEFLRIHREQSDGGFDAFVRDLGTLAASHESRAKPAPVSQTLSGFTNYLARSRRSRRF